MHRLRLQGDKFASKQRSFKHLMEHQNYNLSKLLKAIEINDEKEIVHRLRQPFNDPKPGLIKDRGLYRLSIKLWIKVVCHANPKIREIFRQLRIFNDLQTLLGEINVNLQFINKSSIDSVDGMIEIYQKYNTERQNVLFYCLHVSKKIEKVLNEGSVSGLNDLLETLPKNETELSLSLQTYLSSLRNSRDLYSYDGYSRNRSSRDYFAAQLREMYNNIHTAKHPDKKLDIPETFFKDEKDHIASLLRHTDDSLAQRRSCFVHHYFIDKSGKIADRYLPFFKEIFAIFDRSAIIDYSASNYSNWIGIIFRTENEDLLSQLISKVSLDEVYKRGANCFQADRREVFLRMIMPYFCEIPMEYLKNCSDNPQFYHSINKHDLIEFEIEGRRRVTKIVADEIQCLPIILITIITSYYTLIPDQSDPKFYSFFPVAPITTKQDITFKTGVSNAPLQRH